MAMEEIKLTQNVHNEALSADVPDKKKGGKFQPFKKLFSKRRKKDGTSTREVSAGRSRRPPCVSNGTVSSDDETLDDNLRSFNYSMGTRAFSHDSIFIPDGGAESEQTVQAMSQDNIVGKVKTLQDCALFFSRLSSMFLRQLGKNIKFGQPPPQAVPMKKADSGDASLEEDLFLTSPIEIVTHQDVILCDSENQPSETSSSLSPLNPPAARSEMEEKVTPAKPSRPKRHLSSAGTIESVNLDAIPRAIARLDNSAARHKLAVKPKHQRVSKRHRRLTGDSLGEHGGLPHPLSLDQNGHSGEDKLVWHEEEPEPLAPEDKRCHEEYWRELEAKCKKQKAEAAEKRRLEEQRLQALERRLLEENRQPAARLEEGTEDLPGEEEQEMPQEAEKLRQEEEEREQELWRKREEERRQEELEEQRREEEEERMRELLSQEVEERMEEIMRQEEEWIKEIKRQGKEKMKELRRQMEEKERMELKRLEEERVKELRRQEEEERMKELRRQEEEERMKELKRKEAEEEERMKELRRQKEEEERMKELRRQKEEEERMKELRRQKEEEEERMALKRQEEERMEELRRQKEEERMKELRRQKEEEERMKELRRQKEEEERMKELRRQKEEEEERMALRRQEEERMEELRRQKEEEEEERMKELKRQEEEERMKELRRQEEERMKELKRQEEEEEKKRKEALRKRAEMEAQRRQEAEKKVREEEGSLELAHQRGLRSPRRRMDTAEKADGPQPAEQPREGEEARSREAPQGDRRSLATREGVRAPRAQKPDAPSEEPPRAPAARSGDELRWRELDERQSTPRPYTFQVSSGGKQILFPRVNLSPVTPQKEASAPSPSPEPQPPRPGPAPPPSGLGVPHTAILVTGAQLCGPAVNLSQIKDSACRSLLGLAAEDRRPAEGAGRPRPAPDAPGGGEGQQAEWVSIRSRILRGSDGEPARGDREPPQPPGPEGGDEAAAAAPRRTSSTSSSSSSSSSGGAKFCIKPAWQKFADGDGEGGRRRAAGDAPERAAPPRERSADATDGCQFAKDLPSFLVPGLPSPPPPPPPPPPPLPPPPLQVAEPGSGPDGGGTAEPAAAAGGDEKAASPFGIKLRRTNYSLRFHSDQQAEQKRKKRPGSGGDSGAGADKDAAARPGPARAAAPSAESGPAPAPASSRSPTPEHQRAPTKMPTVQKPALAPKPSSQTPPSSPLSKLSRPYLAELLCRRPGKPDAEVGELSKEPGPRAAPSSSASPPPPPQAPPEEERGSERKPGSPARPASRREKPSPSPEPERREKPVLQSRHSLDGSRLAEKGEPAQPLWITLALQKQKGFREQQATREERRQAREARQAEKLSKDNVSSRARSGSGASISRGGSLHKPVTQPEAQKPQKPEELKPDTAASRLERREHLKKANTLPTSVTVEISDSAPPAPLVKEVTKRLSTPDAAPVSTEPAWLALAKRKAKAWSDCPQIIK
ncbi:LOW QUALITY PROTEIN: capping protein-inhibiting regulator of actin dynamics [Sorex fumeus]|uniref:LOW QUALITY PROTEIN: capping protein-inhibiting regulator of actin dynamics n=1 Tax=Sorex fumeus TaxID=62283 RepID=UPI0024ADA011|nr:LOW QUALITY PROTEIN: capping protein-inhibiting regulator of actin dynamics [Sorex fumeus]